MNADLTPSRIFRSEEFELPLIAEGNSFRVHATVLAEQLGYREAYHMVRVLDDDEKLLVAANPQNCGVAPASGNAYPPARDVWYVTEAGFYRVVGQRNVNVIKDPAVRETVYRFQRWVFHVVLPDMLRAGVASGLEPRYVWNWDEVAAQIRQRYGLSFLPSEITMGLRAAGWLKSGSCTPKSKYCNYFWHTGTAFLVHPYVLPELVADLIRAMQGLGDPRAAQYQLSFFPALPGMKELGA